MTKKIALVIGAAALLFTDGYSHTLTPLVDADGKPLKYNAETGR